MRRMMAGRAQVLLAVALLAIISGAGYEFLSRQRIAKDFPPYGKLIDIGGRSIQLDCRGTGTPVVVFESGMDLNGSLSWSKVHDEVARTTRACAYSRAGMLWSDPAPGHRNGLAVAADLHATLERAGEMPPFVLVGHSLGGPYVLIYTERYGGEVAGLVLVDPSHPDQIERFRRVAKEDFTALDPLAHVLARLSWTGINRIGIAVAQDASKERQILAAFRPTTFAAAVREVEGRFETFAQAGAVRDLGDRPVIVLTAGQSPLSGRLSAEQDSLRQELWMQMHDEIASWSSNGVNRLVPDSSHYIHQTKPDAVVQAVEEVVSRLK
jgi:pimeloyl-ACP methyl ester carboxylesterase